MGQNTVSEEIPDAPGVAPKNKKRDQLAHAKTLRLLEAGASLFFEHLREEGKSAVFGWETLSKKDVCTRAGFGTGTFNYRWPHVREYHGDLAMYILRSPRWREVFAWIRERLIKGLDEVLMGNCQLPDLIGQVAERDIRLRMRLAHWEVTHALLAIDATYASEARAAQKDFHTMHINAMMSVYEVFLDRLNLELKPGRNLRGVAVVLSNMAKGSAFRAIETGDDELNVTLFRQATVDYIVSVVDRSGTASRDSYDVVMEWGTNARRKALHP